MTAYERRPGAPRVPSDGTLEPIEERIMAEVPRGRDGREALRVRFVRARTPDGKEVSWHDVREWYQSDDGKWLPSKKGITVRGKELRAVAIAFLRAVATSVPPSLHESTRALVAALGGAQHAAPTQRATVSGPPPTFAASPSEPSDEECGF